MVCKIISKSFSNDIIQVIDADLIGHQVYLPNTICYNMIINTFGNDILNENHEINRSKLGSIVFSNPNQMNKLKEITWPEIKKSLILLIEKYRNENILLIFIEAAILIEAGWIDLIDELWVVVVDPDIACQRLMKRITFHNYYISYICSI